MGTFVLRKSKQTSRWLRAETSDTSVAECCRTSSSVQAGMNRPMCASVPPVQNHVTLSAWLNWWYGHSAPIM